jgi:D-alanine-D-alanine ligase
MNSKNKLRVCILYDETFEYFDPDKFLQGYEWEIVNTQRPVLDFIRDLEARGHFDVYFNLCDGGMDEDRPGLDVIQALETLNLPFTGADSRFYNPTREVMQAEAELQGVGFAKGFHAVSKRDVVRQASKLQYPLMVKHPNSYGSIGMTRESRVETPEQLRQQVERMIEQYGSARVEEFIEGREFTVLVTDNPDDFADPFVYPPGELHFPAGVTFLDSHVKWHETVQIHPLPASESELAARLQDMCRTMFIAMGGVGYGRCDVRMREDGSLYILEINANCAILYDPEEIGPADAVIDFDPDGHRGFIDRIFRAAIARHQIRQLDLRPARARARVPVPRK